MKSRLILLFLFLSLACFAQPLPNFPTRDTIKHDTVISQSDFAPYQGSEVTSLFHMEYADRVMIKELKKHALVIYLKPNVSPVVLEDYGFEYVRVYSTGNQDIIWNHDATNMILNDALMLTARKGDVYKCRTEKGNSCCEIWRDGKGSPCY